MVVHTHADDEGAIQNKKIKQTNKSNNKKKKTDRQMLTNQWIIDLENILKGQGRGTLSDIPDLVIVILEELQGIQTATAVLPVWSFFLRLSKTVFSVQ